MQIVSKTNKLLYYITKTITFAFGLNSKEVRELLIHHDEKLETCPYRVPFIIKEKASREHLI